MQIHTSAQYLTAYLDGLSPERRQLLDQRVARQCARCPAEADPGRWSQDAIVEQLTRMAIQHQLDEGVREGEIQVVGVGERGQLLYRGVRLKLAGVEQGD